MTEDTVTVDLTDAIRNTTGWIEEPCENPDCEGAMHLFPPVGTLVAVVAKTNAREVGEDATYDVNTGACGLVDGYVAEWHDVHVRFLHDVNLWIDPDNLQSVTHRDNAAPTPTISEDATYPAKTLAAELTRGAVHYERPK